MTLLCRMRNLIPFHGKPSRRPVLFIGKHASANLGVGECYRCVATDDGRAP